MSNALARRKDEKNKTTLRSITQQDDNKVCMDCPMKAPQYAVLNFNIFVCETCSAEHRRLQHKVKGITMSSFTDEEMEELRVGGNAKAAKIWRGTWNRAIHPLPRQGDEVGIRDFIRLTYTEKRWYVEPETEAASIASAPKGLPSLNSAPTRKSDPTISVPVVNKPVIKPSVTVTEQLGSGWIKEPHTNGNIKVEPTPVLPQKKHEAFDDLFSQSVQNPSSRAADSLQQDPFSHVTSVVQPTTTTSNSSNLFEAFGHIAPTFGNSQFSSSNPGGHGVYTNHDTNNLDTAPQQGMHGGFGVNNHMGNQGGFGAAPQQGMHGGFGVNNHMGNQGGFGAAPQYGMHAGFVDMNQNLGNQGDTFNAFEEPYRSNDKGAIQSDSSKPDPFASLF